ncbi:MAG: hypothetical protein PHP11_03335 [Erysipelotrichaceae bacterium]|jgi:hypothetical protein|nr:hypothetical protein [Erysipelotrichaceae bacterium]MDD3924114.1 hypothetical protein [Erysipelotrichaceae bacterium]MDD4643098.1 hypothetical protein [Erysipelotrichaceae bacterium]
MSIAISALVFVVLVFSLTLALFDINKDMQLKQVLYENTRAANQNSLIELANDYKYEGPLTTAAMLERWLINFVDNNLEDIDELTIEFAHISTDPPLYLVRVKGKSSANAYLNAELYEQVISGTTIITDD